METLKHAGQTVVDEVKEKVPFLDGESKPSSNSRIVFNEETNRLHDTENGYKMVSRDKAAALGAPAVAQLVEKSTSRLNGQSKNGSGIGVGKNTAKKASQEKGSSRRSDEQWKQLEALDAKRYQDWNQNLANGQSMEEAFNQAMVERQQRGEQEARIQLWQQRRESFSNNMQDISTGWDDNRDIFNLANQIRQSRSESQRLLDMGEFDEGDYSEKVTKREDELQDLLIRHSGSMSQERQDFIIDFSGGTYNEFIETPVAIPDADSNHAPTSATENDNTYTSTWPEPPKETGSSQGISDAQILTLVEKADPELHAKYKKARDAFVEAHAQERGAYFGDILQRFSKEGSWVEKARNRVGKTFNTKGHRRRKAHDKYEELDIEARKVALAEYHKEAEMDEKQERDKRADLDAKAARQLEYDISEKWRKISENDKRNPGVRRALGIAAAAGAGALSAWLDGPGRGGDDHRYWLAGAVLGGAISGYTAEKFARANYSQESSKDRADEAYQSVMELYEEDPTDSKEDKSMSAHYTEFQTYDIQSKNLNRGKRSTVTMTLGGAAVAYATHEAIEHSDAIMNAVQGAVPDIEPIDINLPGIRDDIYEAFGGEVADNSASTATEEPVPDINLNLTFPSIPDINLDLDVDITPPSDEPALPEQAPAAEPAPPELQPDSERFYVNDENGITQEIVDYADSKGIYVDPDESFAIYEQLEPLGAEGILEGQTLEAVNGNYWIPNEGPDRWTANAQEIIDRNLDANGDGVLNELDTSVPAP